LKFRPTDYLRMLKTPLGRWELWKGAVFLAWPVLRRIASAYRRMLLPATRLAVVTGSLGKTSTLHAVSAILAVPLPRFRFNHYGFLASSLLRVPPGRAYAVFEVGLSGPGQMAAYAHMLKADIAVITSIASDHNRSFKNLECTAREKGALVRALPKNGLAVLNGDDPRVLAMAGETVARTITYGFSPHNQVQAVSYRLNWPEGTVLDVSIAGRMYRINSRLFAKPSMYALLAALAVVQGEGGGIEASIARLERLQPLAGRFQPMAHASGAWFICDDFKAPAESMEAALQFLAEVPATRRIAVLGDVTEPFGKQGPLYKTLGKLAGSVCDLVLLVGNAEEYYLPGLNQSGHSRQTVYLCRRDFRNAIPLLREQLRAGDVVLIKGRHEQRLRRIALALGDASVLCPVQKCEAINLECTECWMMK